jgi:hypothetical protein
MTRSTSPAPPCLQSGFADPAASGAHDMPALRGSHLVLLWSATLVAVLFRAIKQAPATKPHSARHLLGQPRDVGINLGARLAACRQSH